ncbi:hypothetical protein EDC44_12828 [Cricetibacter osteomyelitidis]|uniref:Uncharacterized protein n=1 Tax=Cricetibacter osteomyelitidis TaxID=1521931 RepID=A0A4R2SSC9_9PAST|nr:hypothetical protein [Cricetibacter osteomyelitidis]TCP92075.1 hypothetical protein EDC44_12828 [Cricetibacter osteomyelitidis]
MRKILLFINLPIIFFTLLYGIFSGNLAKNIYLEQEGYRVISLIYNNFNNVEIIKNFKGFEIEIKFISSNELFKILLKDKGYKHVKSNLFCKNKDAITVSRFNDEILLKFSHNSLLCNN